MLFSQSRWKKRQRGRRKKEGGEKRVEDRKGEPWHESGREQERDEERAQKRGTLH